MSTRKVVCSQGHHFYTHTNALIEKLESEVFSLAVPYPELYEKFLHQAKQDDIVKCPICEKISLTKVSQNK